MKWKKIDDKVLYPNNLNQAVQIAGSDIKYLKDVAQTNKMSTARFCAHFSPEEDIHEMLIFHKKGNYLQPHKFHISTESYFLLEGEIDVVLFNDNGKPQELIEMGTTKSQKTFFFRMPRPMFRTIIFKRDSVILEVKTGPFNLSSKELANWAPHHEEISEANKYLGQLSLKLENLL